MFICYLFNFLLMNAKFENEKKVKTTAGISKTWLTGQKSCTLIIPRETARKYELEEPSHVVVEETPSGILIRKLVV
jgi:hypothetical protein